MRRVKQSVLVVVVGVVVGIFALSTAATAQSSDEIDKALLAAPPQLREGAAVIRWNDDFTHDTIREGTNRLVCYDRSGRPAQQPFAVECTSIANLERVAASMRIEAANAESAVRRTAFEAAERAGEWPEPEFGSMFYNLSGPSPEGARPHATVAVPGATGQSMGLPESGQEGGAWIMNAGTSAAHIMVPGM
jgi:hypothetical protein